MDQQLDVLRSEVANSRPLGARLDSARAKLAKACAKEQAAQVQLDKALQLLEESRKQRQLAEENLTELRAEVPQEAVAASQELVRRTKCLLERLESGNFAVNTEMPSEVISAMTAVHEVVNSMQPPAVATLETPLDQEAGENTGEDTQVEKADAHMAELDVMGRLDSVDDSDSEALLEIARRLKRARRS